MRIDADTHVDEIEATWEFMNEADKRFKPISIDPGVATVPGDARRHRRWVIDGHFGIRRWRDDKRTGTTQVTRELLDVSARLRHMDEMRVDIHVIYPTLLLWGPSFPHEMKQPEGEAALAKSYNRWIASRTEESGGRLRWVAVIPVGSMDKALEEVRWAKDHGAVGAMPRGDIYNSRSASSSYFFPLYKEVSRLDMPICLHSGLGGSPAVFTQLAMADVPEKFPGMRVGWIEQGASWIPYLCTDLEAKKRLTFRDFNLRDDLFRRYQFYVTVDTNDDIPYILKYGTEDSLMCGTDYSHADQASEIEALDVLEQRGKQGQISEEVTRKILDDNPRRFYGL